MGLILSTAVVLSSPWTLLLPIAGNGVEKSHFCGKSYRHASPREMRTSRVDRASPLSYTTNTEYHLAVRIVSRTVRCIRVQRTTDETDRKRSGLPRTHSAIADTIVGLCTYGSIVNVFSKLGTAERPATVLASRQSSSVPVDLGHDKAARQYSWPSKGLHGLLGNMCHFCPPCHSPHRHAPPKALQPRAKEARIRIRSAMTPAFKDQTPAANADVTNGGVMKDQAFPSFIKGSSPPLLRHATLSCIGLR